MVSLLYVTNLLCFSYDFPDPQLFYKECHLLKPGWICDPSDVLTYPQRKYKSELVLEISCYCSHNLTEMQPPNAILRSHSAHEQNKRGSR